MGSPLGALLARAPLPMRDWEPGDRETEDSMLSEAWFIGALILFAVLTAFQPT